jgi:hypothetical protein
MSRLNNYIARNDTLLWGTANPEGMDNGYQGIFLNKNDVQNMVQQVEAANRQGQPIPVHLEHKGVAVGHVVSAWAHKDTLQCVLRLNEKVFEGALGSEFVRKGICNELSLGYAVDLQNSETGIKAVSKRLKEISVVKKGARHHCQIHAVGYGNNNK